VVLVVLVMVVYDVVMVWYGVDMVLVWWCFWFVMEVVVYEWKWWRFWDGWRWFCDGGDGCLFMRLMIVMIDKSGGEYGVVMLWSMKVKVWRLCSDDGRWWWIWFGWNWLKKKRLRLCTSFLILFYFIFYFIFCFWILLFELGVCPPITCNLSGLYSVRIRFRNRI
jgi:hypothetical protein